MLKGLFCLRHQVLKVEMGENKRLEMNVKVFFRRKNKVVSELDFALEVFAAAFCFELDFMRLRETGFVFVLMLKAMGTSLRRRDAEAARQVMVFGAIMELHVPTHRNEQHRKGHQKRTDLKQPFFHAAKIQIISENLQKGIIYVVSMFANVPTNPLYPMSRAG